MRTVWKFDLRASVSQVALPADAEIVAVGIQGYDPVLWALLDPSQPYVTRTFVGVTTGAPVEDGAVYRGTFTTPDGLVFHVFERGAA